MEHMTAKVADNAMDAADRNLLDIRESIKQEILSLTDQQAEYVLRKMDESKKDTN